MDYNFLAQQFITDKISTEDLLAQVEEHNLAIREAQIVSSKAKVVESLLRSVSPNSDLKDLREKLDNVKQSIKSYD
jgi:predicted secreted Zn-dependent protease